MKRIYLSGPMHGLPDFNLPSFEVEATRLRQLGFEVVSPHELAAGRSGSWFDLRRNEVKSLCDCDTIAMLPGWQTSNSSRLDSDIGYGVGLLVTQVEFIQTPARK